MTYVPRLELIIICNIYKMPDLKFTWDFASPSTPEDYPYTHSSDSQILIHFCEKGCSLCCNDYMKPFPTLSFMKKR